MSRMVCVTCRKFLHPKKTGVCVEEGMPIAEPGLGDDGRSKTGWGPYKLWMADLYECRECGTEVIAGFGANHFAEHYQKNYAAVRERADPLLRVDDCL